MMGPERQARIQETKSLFDRPEADYDDQFLRSDSVMGSDEYQSARGTSFHTAQDSYGGPAATAEAGGDSHYRTNANADAFDIDAFRRQMGFVPPPRPAPNPPKVPMFGGGRMASVSSDDSVFSDNSDSQSASSRDSISTRAMSNGNPGLFRDPIAPLNAGRAPARKRGFFSKLWSLVRGKGWK